MRDDLCELVAYAQWFVTRLNTNGRRLTPELCRGLYEASLDSVQVTLYSSDAQVHNTLVGAPGFDETVQGIKNAVAADLNCSVNTPLCSLNANYLDTIKFGHSLGIQYVTCSGLIPGGNALGDASRGTRLDSREMASILANAIEYCTENHMEISFTSPGWVSADRLKQIGFTEIPSCGACLSNMAVRPDGGVVPCQSWLSDEVLGNILTDKWGKIWNSPRCEFIRKKSAETDYTCQLATENGREARCK